MISLNEYPTTIFVSSVFSGRQLQGYFTENSVIFDEIMFLYENSVEYRSKGKIWRLMSVIEKMDEDGIFTSEKWHLK